MSADCCACILIQNAKDASHPMNLEESILKAFVVGAAMPPNSSFCGRHNVLMTVLSVHLISAHAEANEMNRTFADLMKKANVSTSKKEVSK